MARIRTIKPEFPQSESMGRVSREARLMFIMLFTLVDDKGITRGNSRMLASLLFPYDDDAPSLTQSWLDELSAEHCVWQYRHEGSSYVQICNWSSHQRIDHPSKSSFPSYHEVISTKSCDDLQIPSNSAPDITPASASSMPDSLVQREIPLDVDDTPKAIDHGVIESASQVSTDTVNKVDSDGISKAESADSPALVLVKPSAAKPGRKSGKTDQATALAWLIENGVEEHVASDWLNVRKVKGVAPSLIAFDDCKNACKAVGITLNEGVRIACSSGWAGMRVAWLEKALIDSKSVRGNVGHGGRVVGFPMGMPENFSARNNYGSKVMAL